jgi:hypothetical protein
VALHFFVARNFRILTPYHCGCRVRADLAFCYYARSRAL